MIFVPLDNTKKSFNPKSIPTDNPVLLTDIYSCSVSIDTKYFPVGVFDITQCFIMPFICLSITISIPSLNLGMINLFFFTETNCGIVNEFFDFLDLNLGNFALPAKNPVYADSKHFKEYCSVWEFISFNHCLSSSFFNWVK